MPMADNVILTWINAMKPVDRVRLASRLDAAGPRAPAMLVAMFAEAMSLTASEVSGLLPMALGQGEQALRALALRSLRAAQVMQMPPGLPVSA